jgi:hypothetical protein
MNWPFIVRPAEVYSRLATPDDGMYAVGTKWDQTPAGVQAGGTCEDDDAKDTGALLFWQLAHQVVLMFLKPYAACNTSMT